jgi:hypothetical protein
MVSISTSPSPIFAANEKNPQRNPAMRAVPRGDGCGVQERRDECFSRVDLSNPVTLG